jgi:hypothetical protein
MRGLAACVIVGVAAIGCWSSGDASGTGGGGAAGASDSASGSGGGGAGSTSASAGGGDGGQGGNLGGASGSGGLGTSSSVSAGGGGAGGGGGSTGGAAFGCACVIEEDCAEGLICYPYGMGDRCTAFCEDGVCPIDASAGCNNMSPAACKPPSDPVCR